MRRCCCQQLTVEVEIQEQLTGGDPEETKVAQLLPMDQQGEAQGTLALTVTPVSKCPTNSPMTLIWTT